MTRTVAAMMLGLLIVANAFADKQVGRLFYTPQQRQQIDNQHKPQQTQRAIPAAPKDAHYNGYVMRSDGVNTVWVNGEVRQIDPSTVQKGQLKLPATPVLKPGQVFDSQAGHVRETYEIAQPEEPNPVVTVSPALPVILPSLANDRDDAPVQGNDVAAP